MIRCGGPGACTVISTCSRGSVQVRSVPAKFLDNHSVRIELVIGEPCWWSARRLKYRFRLTTV